MLQDKLYNFATDQSNTSSQPDTMSFSTNCCHTQSERDQPALEENFFNPFQIKMRKVDDPYILQLDPFCPSLNMCYPLGHMYDLDLNYNVFNISHD
jgi:hypothetical protein